MDFNQINCFISVARTLNFSEAARQNFVSQSTVSRYISELEKEFGVKLFARNHRDVMLTNEGKVLLPYAIEITESLHKAKSVIDRMHNGGEGKISIVFDVVAGAFAQNCIKAFAKRYPDIAVEIAEANSNENIDNTYDFYFTLRDMLPENEEMESVITHKDTLMLVVPKDFNMHDKSVEKMQDERFILLSENVSPILYMEIMDIFRTCHFSPSIISYDSVKALMVAVGAGLGVTVLPEELLKMQAYKDVKVIDIDDIETDITYAMAYKKEASNPATQLFLDIVKELADEELNEEYDI